MDNKKITKIYFIGIGGIGVSALARYHLAKGYQVFGSDLEPSEITLALEKLGAKIYTGNQKAENIAEDIDLVVFSPAVKNDNPELAEAKRRGIKCLSYPEVLGMFTKKHFAIAISGTHGKSTTTAMVGLILVKAGLDPTVIVGTKIKEFGDSNCRIGKSDYIVIEACEHEESFLNYWPKIAVITNIEADHLDYFKNLRNVIKAFKTFAGHLPEDGRLIVNLQDKNTRKILKGVKAGIVNYYSPKSKDARRLRKIMQIPGEHNVSDALAALTVARILKVPDKISFSVLADYKGSWRRFEKTELRVKNRKLTIISDYGHHPTEVSVTLKAAREKFKGKKIWCIFQPHQYQRTHYLFNEFVGIFRNPPLELLIITDIFDVAGRENEEIKRKVSSEKLVNKIGNKKVLYLPKCDIMEVVKNNIESIDVLIVMGAGDIYKFVEKISKMLGEPGK